MARDSPSRMAVTTRPNFDTTSARHSRNDPISTANVTRNSTVRVFADVIE